MSKILSIKIRDDKKIKKKYVLLKWEVLKRISFGNKTICCPICNGLIQKVCTNTRFEIVRCLDCGHATTRVQACQKNLGVLYDCLDYWYKDKEHQGIVSFWDGDWDCYLRPRLEAVYKYSNLSDLLPKKILEIGCSEGRLLYEFKQRGHNVLGFESNKELAQAGSQEFLLPIVGEDFDIKKIGFEKFDLILAFHTIEHIADVQNVVSQLRSVSSVNGAVVAELPIEKEYDNPDHVHFFTKK